MDVMINYHWPNQNFTPNTGVSAEIPAPPVKDYDEPHFMQPKVKDDSYLDAMMDIKEMKNFLYMMIGSSIRVKPEDQSTGRSLNMVA